MQQSILLNKKIQEEKRRRNQLYITLDYLFSGINYFEYFSFDAFSIVKNTKYLANFYKKANVDVEALLLSFLFSNSQISKIFKDLGISKEKILFFFSSDNAKLKNYFLFEWRQIFSNFFFPKEYLEDFSDECNFIFERSAENAFFRFKTPIITPEILFLTFLEEKETKLHKFFKTIIKKETDWYLLRYRLIKTIHHQESLIRNEVSKNQYYFAYLLKTQLTDKEFEKLETNELLGPAVSLFRNHLILSLLKQNYFELLSKEVSLSIELTNIRRYSD
jgi:hypothetical protein